MKLTTKQLKQIIKEEFADVLEEVGRARGRRTRKRRKKRERKARKEAELLKAALEQLMKLPGNGWNSIVNQHGMAGELAAKLLLARIGLANRYLQNTPELKINYKEEIYNNIRSPGGYIGSDEERQREAESAAVRSKALAEAEKTLEMETTSQAPEWLLNLGKKYAKNMDIIQTLVNIGDDIIMQIGSALAEQEEL